MPRVGTVGEASSTIDREASALGADGGSFPNTPASGSRAGPPVPPETSAHSSDDDEAGTGPNLNVPKDDEDDALPDPRAVSKDEAEEIRRRAYLKATGQQDESAAPKRDEHGRFKPRDEKQAKAEAKDDGPSDQTEEGRELILGAREILRKAQYPAEDIEKMPAAELIRRARPLSKMFGDTQKAFDELNALRQQMAGKKHTDAPGEPEAVDSKQSSDPESALGADDERLEALLSEYDDAELTKAVRAAVTRHRDNAAAETKAAREQAAQAIVRQVRDHVGSVRKELEQAYPKLKDDAEFEDILQRMEARERKNGYPSVREGRDGILNLMAGVAFVKYGKQIKADHRDEIIRESRRVKSGHPSANGIPSRGNTGNNGASRPAVHDMVAAAMRGGGSFEDMQRRLHAIKTGAGQ